MTSVLNSAYVPPEDRPYSQNELNFLRKSLHDRLRLGPDRAHHRECNHYYFVRLNSKKEKEIQETGNSDTGSCSVCWKLRNTPRNLVSTAKSLVNQYTNIFSEEQEKFSLKLTYDTLDTESSYYRWLFIER